MVIYSNLERDVCVRLGYRRVTLSLYDGRNMTANDVSYRNAGLTENNVAKLELASTDGS